MRGTRVSEPVVLVDHSLKPPFPTSHANKKKTTPGKNGVVSVYDYEYAQDTWTALQGIKARKGQGALLLCYSAICTAVCMCVYTCACGCSLPRERSSSHVNNLTHHVPHYVKSSRRGG